MRAPSREKRMDEKVELKSVKYELSDKKYLKDFIKSTEVKVVEGVNGKSKPIIKIESSNTILIRGLESEINRENYENAKLKGCIYKGSCSKDNCDICPYFTPRKSLSLDDIKKSYLYFGVEDRGPSVEDKVIRKEMIREGLKKLKKVDALLEKVTKMALLGDTCEFIEMQTGIPKSTVSDMLKKANEFFSKLS